LAVVPNVTELGLYTVVKPVSHDPLDRVVIVVFPSLMLRLENVKLLFVVDGFM
jgi:hypothetical protein